MAKIQLHIIDSLGKSLANELVSFSLGQLGSIQRTSDSDGIVSVSGLDVGEYSYKVNDIIGSFKIDDDSQTVIKDIVAQAQEIVTDAVDKAVDNVANSVTDTLEEVNNELASQLVSAYIFKTSDNIDYSGIKEAVNNLKANINAQKDVLEDALKNGYYELVSAQGKNLVAVASQSFQPLMDVVIKKRSEINPFSSFKNFGLWAKYSSIIGLIYTLRQTTVSFLNKYLEKIQNKI